MYISLQECIYRSKLFAMHVLNLSTGNCINKFTCIYYVVLAIHSTDAQ